MPRVHELVRELEVADGPPRYTGVFMQEVATQTVFTEVKDFKSVLHELDSVHKARDDN